MTRRANRHRQKRGKCACCLPDQLIRRDVVEAADEEHRPGHGEHGQRVRTVERTNTNERRERQNRTEERQAGEHPLRGRHFKGSELHALLRQHEYAVHEHAHLLLHHIRRHEPEQWSGRGHHGGRRRGQRPPGIVRRPANVIGEQQTAAGQNRQKQVQKIGQRKASRENRDRESERAHSHGHADDASRPPSSPLLAVPAAIEQRHQERDENVQAGLLDENG